MASEDVADIESFFARPDVAAQAANINDRFIRAKALEEQPKQVVSAYSVLDSLDNPRESWLHGPRIELALVEAIFHGRLAAVEWLFPAPRVSSLGAAMAFFLPRLVNTAIDSCRECVLDMLLSSEVFSEFISDADKTYILNRGLLAAMQRGFVNIGEVFISHGAVVNDVEAVEYLAPAWYFGNRQGDAECVEALSDNGVFFVGAPIDLKRFVLSGRHAVLAALIHHGVNVDAGRVGATLHEFVWNLSFKPLQQILAITPFVDVDSLNEHQQSPLMKIWQNPNRLGGYWDLPVKIAKLLIQHGADVNLRDKDGYTPLHNACRIHSPGVITVLLENGANPHARSLENESPHDLIDVRRIECRDFYESADLLLEYGAEFHDQSGRSESTYGRLAQSADGRAFLNARPQYFDSRES